MKSSHFYLAFLGACLLVGIWGSDCIGPANPDAGTGQLRVLVTDKPYPIGLIESAVVTVTEVKVRRGDECAEAADCDDGDLCTTDACVDGTCTNEPVDCDDGDACTTDTCDSSTGECLSEDVVCEAGSVCVEGECLLSCVEDADCDDADLCTTDSCVNDVCVNAAPDCGDGDACTVDGCDSSTGECTNDPLDCEAGSTCVEGECVLTCVEDSDCDDGESCTEDTCAEGLCVYTDDDCDEDDGDEEDDAWVTVFEGEKSFDLLDLQNGRTDLLADAEIPAGTYTQMRLVVTEGVITLTDGTPFEIRVPSGSSSGIKLHFTFEVLADEETTLLLDVDLSKAFVPIPGGDIEDPSQIQRFQFKPSVAMRLVDLVDAGSIGGTITDEGGTGLGLVMATAIDSNGNEVTSTISEDDGTYLLTGLLGGTYTVEFSADGYVDQTSAAVEVNAGETTTIDVVLTAEP